MSQQEFGVLFNVSRDNIASYERGTEPKIEFISSVVNYFHISYDDLIEGDLSTLDIFKAKSTENVPLKNGDKLGDILGDKPKVQKTSPNKGVYRNPNGILTASDIRGEYRVGSELIPIVDISAAAGGGAFNPDYIDQVDSIQLPARLLHKGVHNCIRVEGQSMLPTLQDGGYLIIRLLDPSEWVEMKDEYIYVVTNREGQTFVKRVKNRLRQHGFIVCMSDSPEKMTFPNFNIYEEDIHNIWFVEWYLSAKMPNIHQTYYSKVKELEDDVDDIKATLAKLLKKPSKRN